jgi:NAD(P)H-dependent flavin oxidoreductase YrpB (nitropropane dioxygenase family)
MHTPICDELGIEFPIFAFTHCRDVVVAVSNAGGFGVLGAVGFTPEQLEIELTWIDDNIGDHPYGVDIVIPNKYEGMDSQLSADDLADTLRSMVPQEHLEFARKILADHGVPVEDSDSDSLQLLGWTEATATPQVEAALRHPKVAMIANALGTPPPDMIKHIHTTGRKVAALCGSPSQARKHADAGVDIIIAQGGEAGGHCGEVGSIVLWPQVIKEVAPVPVLAAGGIGSGQQIAAALALGAAVVDGRRGVQHPGAAGRLCQGEQSGHRPQPFLHRQTGPDAAQRLDRSLGAAGQPETARDAAAVHGVWDGGARHEQVPERVGRRRVQPGWPGRRPVQQGREDGHGH